MTTHATTAKTGGGALFTPFNLVVGVILAIGAFLTVLRFTGGLGAVTNLSDDNPWGIWIAFDLMCGVALAAGGYTTSAACYVFGLKRYHGAVRPAILTAFLGYSLVVFALHYDVGQPWRLPYPVFLQQGTTSILFEVGLCVFIYLTVLFVEFLPVALEWKGWARLRHLLVKLTMALTILGVILSTMHQSSLGALFLIAPSKLHPLWYSPYLPVFFFVSSMFAGLSMVIFEGSLSHRWLHHKMDAGHLAASELVVLGFAKAASFIMFGYLSLKAFGLAMDNRWQYLMSGYGAWFLVEILIFVALPCYLYAVGARDKNLGLIRKTSILAVLGIVLNRFNICLVAFNWQLPAADRYFPSLGEVGISLFVVAVGLVAFKFITTRMPVFHEHPDFPDHQ
jgi:Ni/Fe-hydrogenase subunit HybB-like protein